MSNGTWYIDWLVLLHFGQEQSLEYKNCLSCLVDVQGSWLVWWILKTGWCQLEIPKILANTMGFVFAVILYLLYLV